MAEATTQRPEWSPDPETLIPVGTRVRHRKHTDLTGSIKAHEYNRPGVPSPIPYNVAWDNNDEALDRLGWFWIYADDQSIEAA